MVVCKVIGFHPLGCIKDALQALTGQIIFVEMILVMDTPSINAGKINEGAGHVGRLPARPFDFVATSGRCRLLGPTLTCRSHIPGCFNASGQQSDVALASWAAGSARKL
jgi:hypothetical protein